jgi:hypothetical protein
LVGLWELARGALGRRERVPSPVTESAGKMTADGISAGALGVTAKSPAADDGADSQPGLPAETVTPPDSGAPRVPHA